MDGCKMTSEEEEIEIVPFSAYAAMLFVGFIYISLPLPVLQPFMQVIQMFRSVIPEQNLVF